MIASHKVRAFLGTYQEGPERFPVHIQLHPGVDSSSIFLTGSSGSGKSTAGQDLAIQFANQGLPVLAVDIGHTLSPDHICKYQLFKSQKICGRRIHSTCTLRQ